MRTPKLCVASLGSLAGVLLLAAAAAPTPAVATYPGANGRIAYIGFVDGPRHDRSELFTIQPDGTQLERLTNNDLFESDPAWSPDGGRLAFSVSGLGGQSASIYTIRADGSDLRLITRVRYPYPHPSFTKSGRRLLVTTGSKLVTVRADGAGRKRVIRSLPRRGGWFSNHRYSPDGRWIMLIGTPGRKARSGIWKMRRDGTDPRLLLAGNPRDFDLADLDTSPDGRWVAFSRYYDGVWLMRANGKQRHEIAGTFGFGSPAFAPAGDRIALNNVWPGNYLIPHCGDVFTMSPDGFDRRRVTSYSNGSGSCPGQYAMESVTAGNAAWQPVPTPGL